MRLGGGVFKLILATGIALISFFIYYFNTEQNPVTGEMQHVDISIEQEIALGLQSVPEMADQYGGLHPDENAQLYVKEVGNRLVNLTEASGSPYAFDFHVLADENTINAFALPGGQIFITAGLLKKLETEDQLAAVLGHEIGHVIGRHGAEQISKMKLTRGLTGAAVIAAFDPDNPSEKHSAAAAVLISKVVHMKFSRDDEMESDKWSVASMIKCRYQPEAIIELMEILMEDSVGNKHPEFFSTHTNPENRISEIQKVIGKKNDKNKH